MSIGDRLEDYVDVDERIAAFFVKYPEGRLRPYIPWSVREVGEQLFLVYEAAAYRTADDPLPGIGVAWEPFPGRTTFTRDSELMNAETAARGRALIAVGIAARRVPARRPAPAAKPAAPTEHQQEPCTTCGHAKGDHKHSGSRSLSRAAPGFCLVEDCKCRLYQPPAAKPAAQRRTTVGASDAQRRSIHALIAEKQIGRQPLAGLLEPLGVELSEGWMDRLTRGREGTASRLIDALRQQPTPPPPVQPELGGGDGVG